MLKFLFVSLYLGSIFCGQSQNLPRFASLRSNAVQMHVGPGTKYPIEWKFIRQGLPVEILAVFDTWRRIRDHQGTEGWVHQSLLSGKRTILITGSLQNLHNKPDSQSQIIARIEPGVLGLVLETQANWCKIEIRNDQGNFRGWVSRKQIWGLYASEAKI